MQAAVPAHRRPRPIRNLLLHLFLITGSVAMLLPFIWMLSTSLKTPPQIFTYPPVWIPDPIAWQNYRETVSVMPFGRFYLNSLIVASAHTLVTIIFACLAAYAYARLDFPGRNVIFGIMLATLFLPGIMFLVPNFVTIHRLGQLDSFLPVFVHRPDLKSTYTLNHVSNLCPIG